MVLVREWTYKRRHQSLRRRIEIERDELPGQKVYLNITKALDVGIPGLSLERFGLPDRFKQVSPGKCELEGAMWRLTVQTVADGVEMELGVQNRSPAAWPEPFALGTGLSPRSPLSPAERACPTFCDRESKERTVLHTGYRFWPIRDQRRHFFHQQQIEDILALPYSSEIFQERNRRGGVPYLGAGVILRVGKDPRWVLGYGWDRTVCVSSHNDDDALNVTVQLGPLRVGEYRTVRGLILFFQGSLEEALGRFRRFVGPAGSYDARARRREVLCGDDAG